MNNEKIDTMMRNVVMTNELEGKILERTVDKRNKGRNITFKRLVLVFMISVLTLGTLTALGKEKIQQYLFNKLGIDQTKQEQLIQDGHVVDMDVSDTDNGVTVTVKQTIIENNSLKILLHVKSENGVKLDDRCMFEDIRDEGIEYEVCRYDSGEMINDSLYEKWYILRYDCLKQDEVNENGIIKLELNNIIINRGDVQLLGKVVRENEKEYIVIDENGNEISSQEIDSMREEMLEKNESIDICLVNDEEYMAIYKDEYVVRGKWQLSFEYVMNTKTASVSIGVPIEGKSCSYHISTIEVSPLSYKLQIAEGYEKLSLDDYKSIDIKFVMQDGTVCINSNSQIFYNEEFVWIELDEVMDVDELKSITVEDMEFVVK